MSVNGVDVSNYQGSGWTPRPVDNFVFIKTTEGRSYVSPTVKVQTATARAAGLVVGFYHFMWPSTASGTPEQQARFFLDKAPVQDGDLLVCDWETTGGGHPSVSDAARFIAEVKRLKPGNRVGLYCNKSDWRTTEVKAGDFLWLAHYTGQTDVTGWTFWQWTDKPLDQNRSRFATVADLRAWAVGGDQPPTPEPPGAQKPEEGQPVRRDAKGREIKTSTQYGADFVTWNGGRVTVKDAEILDAIAAEVLPWWGRLELTQGGLSSTVAASAATHNGLGAFDVRTAGRSKVDVWRLCSVGLRCGQVWFPRGFNLWDTFSKNKHVHVVSRESYDSLHAQAKAQYQEFDRFRRGASSDGDGLRGAHRYDGPTTPFERWATSPYNPANITAEAATLYVNVETFLYGLDVDRKTVAQRERGHKLETVKRIRRWGRDNAVTASGTFYAAEFLSVEEPAPVEPPPKPDTAVTEVFVTANGHRSTDPDDRPSWSTRRDEFNAALKSTGASVVMGQELTPTQRSQIPGYSWHAAGNVCVGWSSAWSVLHKNVYRLETGGDDRSCVVVVLEHKKTRRELKIASTHLTNLEGGGADGNGWRIGQARDIVQSVSGLDVLGGDFNDSGAVYGVLSAAGLVELRRKLPEDLIDGETTRSTHHYGPAIKGGWIDNICTRDSVAVRRAWLVRTDSGSRFKYASDHHLIAAEVEV